MLPEKYRFIVVEGNIGAGKTSLARMLASDLNAHLVLEEFAENSFLPHFYEDPAKFAFPLEMSFLAARYKQLAKIFHDAGSKRVVADYHIVKSLLFARVNLPAPELELYESFFEMTGSRFPEPDALIYLDPGIPQLEKNIRKRSREFEKKIRSEYLKNIESGYEKLLKTYPLNRLIRINSSALDFINNQSDYQFIINKLIEGLRDK